MPAGCKYTVKTTNGETRAVESVEAVVLDDNALDGMLIGVSFLKRLAKYQVENGALLMVQ